VTWENGAAQITGFVGGPEMKLQEFVNETLREIIAGVKEAQAYATGNGAIVNPGQSAGGDGKLYSRERTGNLLPITDIDFDVAVTSTDTTEQQAGAGIFVAGFGIGTKGKSDASNSCVSRIRFPVRIVLPVQDKK
jgi:hypothetical protein